MGTLTNSEDIISSGSALFVKIKQIRYINNLQGEKIHDNLEILTYEPLKCTVDHPKFITSNKVEDVMLMCTLILKTIR